MFVTTNNAELFFNAFPIESRIILVLDRLQCMARVNCQVSIIVLLYCIIEEIQLSLILDEETCISIFSLTDF